MSARRNLKFNLIKLSLSFFIASAIFLFLPKNIFAQNLLQNPGFEELDNNWLINHSAIRFTYSSDFYLSGSKAARVTNTSSSSYGIEQIIPAIESGQEYGFSGYTYSNDTNTSSVRLRLAWYESTDGSGPQVSTIDSNVVNSPTYEWKYLSGNTKAPQNVHSAKLRAIFASKTTDTEASVYFDDIVFEKVDSSTPTATLVLSTSTPTPTSFPGATYKINEVKDQNGNILSNVEIYVDDKYTHHYVPETFTFGDGQYCDDEKQVNCGFGEHTIRLEKDGFKDWQETVTTDSGFNKEVAPVMSLLDSDPSSTPTLVPTPTIKPTITPTPKNTPTKKITPTPTGATEIVLAAATSITPTDLPVITEKKSSNNLLPFVFVGLGLLFLAVSGVLLFKTKNEGYNN